MPDWTKPMEQSYEYYIAEPIRDSDSHKSYWADVKRLNTVKKASFNRDADSETLGSASIDVADTFGETYIRAYLKTIQNGVTEKHPLGTVLVQTPSSTFNGKITNVTMDAYTPLIELKENRPPLGYTIRKGARILDEAFVIVRDNARAPVTKVELEDSPILQENFTANTDDTWLSFVIALIAKAEYELGLDETGHILFQPKQELDSLQPVWTYNDDNSSILFPEITMNHDLYGIPNVVEVIYSYGDQRLEAVAKNEDPNSPTSIQNRGRTITYRDTDPGLNGYVTQGQINDYAKRLLRALSTVEYTVSYKHAYCPVRLGDCVRLNYKAAGIVNVKAKVVSQSITCDLGCPVSETAVFTTKLWR